MTAAKTATAARPKAKTGKTAPAGPGTVAPEVEAYLAALPAEQRAALQRLRGAIRSMVPEATEEISYGIPMFKLGTKGVVAYNAVAGGGTLQVMSSAALAAHAGELAGYRTGRGSVRFTLERPLPEALVKQLVKERIAENQQPRNR